MIILDDRIFHSLVTIARDAGKMPPEEVEDVYGSIISAPGQNTLVPTALLKRVAWHTHRLNENLLDGDGYPRPGIEEDVQQIMEIVGIDAENESDPGTLEAWQEARRGK